MALLTLTVAMSISFAAQKMVDRHNPILLFPYVFGNTNIFTDKTHNLSEKMSVVFAREGSFY